MATTKQAERTERKPDERKAGKPRTAAQGALSVSCRSHVRSWHPFVSFLKARGRSMALVVVG